MLKTEIFCLCHFSFSGICLWFSCHILTSPFSKGQLNAAALFLLNVFPLLPTIQSSLVLLLSPSQPGSFLGLCPLTDQIISPFG